MQIINTNKFIKIIADDGMKITNKDRTIYLDRIFLPITANIDEYEEVGREVWKFHVQEENPDIVELQEQVKDLQSTDNITMCALAESNEDVNTNIDIILNAINELYLMIEDLMSLKGGE